MAINKFQRSRLTFDLSAKSLIVESHQYILKAIKNATGASLIFPINISLIHFVFVLTSAPNVGEGFAKT